MTNPKAIRDQIITILNMADPKNGSGASVKNKWVKGEPIRSRWPGFPWGWVEWGGGVMEAPVGSKAMIRDIFFVAVVDKHIEVEKAEDSVMEFAESVEAALDDDSTIGGLVAASYVVNREKIKWFEKDSDYSFRAVGLTLTTRRRE